MVFPEYAKITAQTLRDIQASLNLPNKQMAELVGVSEKTWLNRKSSDNSPAVKLLSKLEYAYLVELSKSRKTS